MIRILVEGDLHSGEVLGLAHPDHWPARKRRMAQKMWDWRRERLHEIGRVDVHIIGGDMIEGIGRKETLGLLTTEIDEQAEMAEEAIREVKADYRFFTYGTPYHVASFIKGEKLVAKAFEATPRETWRIGPFHGRYLMDRHVLGRSDTVHAQGTPLWREWVRDEIQAVLDEYKAADIHTRHHVHYCLAMTNGRVHAMVCPCWKMPTPPDGWGSPYPWTLRTQYYNVGNLLVEIDRTGEVYVRPQLMPLKIVMNREYTCPEIKGNTFPDRAR